MGQLYTAKHEKVDIEIKIPMGMDNNKCPTCGNPMSTNCNQNDYCRVCLLVVRNILRGK